MPEVLSFVSSVLCYTALCNRQMHKKINFRCRSKTKNYGASILSAKLAKLKSLN